MRSVMVLAALALAVGCARREEGGAVEAPAVTYTPMTADELADEWARNPAAAVEKYKAQGVELSGTLLRVGANVAGEPYIEVQGVTGSDWRHAGRRDTRAFVVGERAAAGLRNCVVGEPVVVKARADGATMGRPWLVADEIRPGR